MSIYTSNTLSVLSNLACNALNRLAGSAVPCHRDCNNKVTRELAFYRSR